jgi:4-hydroxybenzoate polyprenyltransferase
MCRIGQGKFIMVDVSLGDNTPSVRVSKFKAILSLTRWREHVPYTIPVVVIGAMLALHQTGGEPNLRLLAVVLANILAQAFAFMINDVADAPDDALHPKKAARNMVSNGTLTYREGMMWSWLTFGLALALFAFGGGWTFVLGVLQLVLCYLYSAHPFRWKAQVVTDVLSHALMLCALLVMTGYFLYNDTPNAVWLIFAAAFFFSAYGQFFNQIDDYEVDKAAGLRNTVVVLGPSGTRLMMYGSIVLAAGCALLAITYGIFPAWLAPVALVVAFSCTLFVWDTDMRGNNADGSGMVQKPVLLLLNIVALMWLVQTLGWLPF